MSHWVFRQLGKSLDLTRSTGRGAPATAAIVERKKMPEDLPAQHMLVRARAVSAAVAAEQARRKLNLDTRKYVLAELLAREWGNAVARILRNIEEGGFSEVELRSSSMKTG